MNNRVIEYTPLSEFDITKELSFFWHDYCETMATNYLERINNSDLKYYVKGISEDMNEGVYVFYSYMCLIVGFKAMIHIKQYNLEKQTELLEAFNITIDFFAEMISSNTGILKYDVYKYCRWIFRDYSDIINGNSTSNDMAIAVEKEIFKLTFYGIKIKLKSLTDNKIKYLLKNYRNDLIKDISEMFSVVFEHN